MFTVYSVKLVTREGIKFYKESIIESNEALDNIE